jgi:2-dehydropantoate 2-reductase
MRICIYGAGAIGAWLGVQMSLAGEDVTLIARGPHLAAMQKNGVKLLIGGEEKVAHPRCVEDPRDAGPQDYVIITLKAHSFPGIVDSLQHLFDDNTAVVTGVNGIPWWYFYQLEGPYENHKLESVDPGGRIWDVVGPERALGCVVYPAAEIAEPGVIRHIEGDRFILGEPDGRQSERVVSLCEALKNAGFTSRVRNNIRDDIWVKLWGNLCFNPISALTHATQRRQAPRRRCGRWRAQDLDAAGPGTGQADGNRCPGYRCTGAGPARRSADADDRCRARAHSTTCTNGRYVLKVRRDVEARPTGRFFTIDYD